MAPRSAGVAQFGDGKRRKTPWDAAAASGLAGRMRRAV